MSLVQEQRLGWWGSFQKSKFYNSKYIKYILLWVSGTAGTWVGSDPIQWSLPCQVILWSCYQGIFSIVMASKVLRSEWDFSMPNLHFMSVRRMLRCHRTRPGLRLNLSKYYIELVCLYRTGYARKPLQVTWKTPPCPLPLTQLSRSSQGSTHQILVWV